MKINILGDLAGRYNEMLELLAKMPAADLVLSVGDLIDRGPASRQVIEWFMADPIGREALFANHEQMFISAWELHQENREHTYWSPNGGVATLASFGGWKGVSPSVIDWLTKRPAWFSTEDLFVSHAPVWDVNEIPPQYGFDYHEWARQADQGNETGWVWNRYLSQQPMPGKHMVYGHNGCFRDGVYATCIDNSSRRELTGMHWPTKEIFTVEYANR